MIYIRTLLSVLICFATLAVSAQDRVIRLECDYNADYSFSNKVSEGQATESGIVVYYLYPTKDGKYDVDYNKYPDSISCNATNPTKYTKTIGLEILSEFWPIPGKTDSEAKYRDTVVTRNMAPLVTSDDIKLQKIIGMGTEVHRWQIKDTYLPTGAVCSMVQDAAFTGEGVQYRRCFGAVPTECETRIRVTIRDTATMSAKEAKARRKCDHDKYEGSFRAKD